MAIHEPMAVTQRHSPIRVLLVPDVPYWICGTIARALARHTPGIDATLCAGRVLRALPNLQARIARFDVVHFLTPQDANKSIATFQGRVATVTTIHHVQDESSLQCAGQSDAIMTASRQWHDRLLGLGVDGAKLATVPYGVDTAIFRPPGPAETRQCRERLGLRADTFTIGFVGKRASDAGGRKGTDVFVQGVHALARGPASIQVLVIGPGWGEFAAALRTAGVHCVWMPFVLGDQAFSSMYHAMDAYWCTSTIEGGPVPVLEAMASGVCCLATVVGMAPELIRPKENGFLMPFDDAAAFVEQTAALMDDQKRREDISLAAARTIREGFDWAMSAKHAVDLYERALRNFNLRTDRRPAVRNATAPWPGDWIEKEERAMTDRFVHDAHHPPGALAGAIGKVRDSRWARGMVARWGIR